MDAEAIIALLHWTGEREAIRLRREAGCPKPWTSDPILRDNRFCNVRREDDKVTKWIAEHVRKPLAGSPLLPAGLALARHINRIETLERLFCFDYWWERKYNPNYCLTEILDQMKAAGEQIYGAAYVMRAESNPEREWFSWPKHRYIVEVVAGQVWRHRERIAQWAADPEHGFEFTWKYLSELYGWGEFMAFQVAVDLRHTAFFEKSADLKTFVAFGPGTRRGLNRMFGRDINCGVRRSELHSNLSAVQKLLRDNTPFDLEPYDVANCMCELDKYMRGGGKQRYPGSKGA